jgi:hypothetical protein
MMETIESLFEVYAKTSLLSKLALLVSYPSFAIGYPFPKAILLCRQYTLKGIS